MSPVVAIAETRQARERQWMEIDFAMKAISVAMHQAQRAGLPMVVEQLGIAHKAALAERDRA